MSDVKSVFLLKVFDAHHPHDKIFYIASIYSTKALAISAGEKLSLEPMTYWNVEERIVRDTVYE